MINFIMLHEKSIHPTRGSKYSVGYDLYAHSSITLDAQATTKIGIGISLSLSDHTVWGEIKDRSSMGKNGLHVFGGVVDPDYTGEICVLIHNTNKFDIRVNPKDRIAQMVFHSMIVDTHGEMNETIRGDGGFGSTGK